VIIGQALLVVIGGTMVVNGRLTAGELTAFVLYLTFFFAPIQQLVQLYNGYQQGQASAKKLREVLSNQPSVHEAADAEDLPPIDGEITFDGVTFGY
ncbi:MAG: ABC transporter ATP-binding protein, partial [bacterium]|nr:ABC transporter ATP-binding protein [bacterium]